VGHELRVGTRGSELALRQTRWVEERLAALFPSLRVTVRVIRTTGDAVATVPLGQMEGKAFFVKQIEEALLEGQIDIAVHSAKDLPSVLPPGLTLAAVPERETPFDALVSRTGQGLAALQPGARVGTSSVRRRAQLLAARPDLEVVPLRGNVDTRLRKLRQGQVDAIVVAAAGLRRMGRDGEITEMLAPEVCLPCVGQGALAVEAKEDDDLVLRLARALNHDESFLAVSAERAFLEGLHGGCQVPATAYAEVQGGNLTLRGMVADPDGKRIVRATLTGPRGSATELGRKLAEKLLRDGGEEILAQLRR